MLIPVTTVCPFFPSWTSPQTAVARLSHCVGGRNPFSRSTTPARLGQSTLTAASCATGELRGDRFRKAVT